MIVLAISHPSLLPSILAAVGAFAALVTALATVALVLRMGREVRTVKADVNSKATESTERIEQLTRILAEQGVDVPPRRDPPVPPSSKKP